MCDGEGWEGGRERDSALVREYESRIWKNVECLKLDRATSGVRVPQCL